MPIPWEPSADGLRLALHVTPRARRNEIGGLLNGRLCVKVTAAPEDGKANRAVVKLLAKRLGIAPSSLEIITGLSSRDKTLLARGASLEDVPLVLAED